MAKKQEEAAMEQQEQAAMEPEAPQVKEPEVPQVKEPEVPQVKEPEVPQVRKKMWIRVRKPVGSQEDGKLVSVNEKNWLIQFNRDVMVPVEVYDALKYAARAEIKRDLYIEQLTRGRA